MSTPSDPSGSNSPCATGVAAEGEIPLPSTSADSAGGAREELERLKRTVEFSEQEYLRTHGGSWGECKYQGQVSSLQRENEELTKHFQAFQAFHKNLCERFGATHDEKDWRRDLCSLEEHIASRLAKAEAALLKLCECNRGGYCIWCGYDMKSGTHRDGCFVAAALAAPTVEEEESK